MAKVFLSLGSNMGDRGYNLQQALLGLERWGAKVVRVSSIYETEPVGLKEQPMFYNMVAQVETELSPVDLWKAIFAIEQSLKRERTVQWGPRTIDIDILFYDDQVLQIEDEETSDDIRTILIIPHVRLQERRFVLVPLAEIAPQLVHPVFKKTVDELLKECDDPAIVKPL